MSVDGIDGMLTSMKFLQYFQKPKKLIEIDYRHRKVKVSISLLMEVYCVLASLVLNCEKKYI